MYKESPWNGDYTRHYWADDDELDAREEREERIREEQEYEKWEKERW